MSRPKLSYLVSLLSISKLSFSNVCGLHIRRGFKNYG
jgi:hypothetical protein